MAGVGSLDKSTHNLACSWSGPLIVPCYCKELRFYVTWCEAFVIHSMPAQLWCVCISLSLSPPTPAYCTHVTILRYVATNSQKLPCKLQSVTPGSEICVKSRGRAARSFRRKRAARKLIFLPYIADIWCLLLTDFQLRMLPQLRAGTSRIIWNFRPKSRFWAHLTGAAGGPRGFGFPLGLCRWWPLHDVVLSASLHLARLKK